MRIKQTLAQSPSQLMMLRAASNISPKAVKVVCPEGIRKVLKPQITSAYGSTNMPCNYRKLLENKFNKDEDYVLTFAA